MALPIASAEGRDTRTTGSSNTPPSNPVPPGAVSGTVTTALSPVTSSATGTSSTPASPYVSVGAVDFCSETAIQSTINPGEDIAWGEVSCTYDTAIEDANVQIRQSESNGTQLLLGSLAYPFGTADLNYSGPIVSVLCTPGHAVWAIFEGELEFEGATGSFEIPTPRTTCKSGDDR